MLQYEYIKEYSSHLYFSSDRPQYSDGLATGCVQAEIYGQQTADWVTAQHNFLRLSQLLSAEHKQAAGRQGDKHTVAVLPYRHNVSRQRQTVRLFGMLHLADTVHQQSAITTSSC